MSVLSNRESINLLVLVLVVILDLVFSMSLGLLLIEVVKTLGFNPEKKNYYHCTKCVTIIHLQLVNHTTGETSKKSLGSGVINRLTIKNSSIRRL
jgi:hypothetical protein